MHYFKMYGIYGCMNTREHEVTWQVKFFLAPIVGGIIGGVIYLLMVAGLLVLSD